MGNTAQSRFSGDDYQALYFWLEACRLFLEHTRVTRVGYELNTVKAFDDVAVFYEKPIPDERGDLITADCYQIKFHVDCSGAFTWKDLMSPDFINASSVSLLQRLQLAHQNLPEEAGYRFHILAPWPIDPNDTLARLVSNQGGEIRLDTLFKGGPRSEMGKIRQAWIRHLGLADDNDLRQVLRHLRISANTPTLQQLREQLNDRLLLAGFKPIPAEAQASLYGDLIRKLRVAGQAEFTRQDLETIGKREGIWQAKPIQRSQAIRLGLRSFMRYAEHMEDETNHMLCLVRHFDNRTIQEAKLWQSAIFPEVKQFLDESRRSQQQAYLHLDVHASIAFAAGYCLDAKCGLEVILMQRTRAGLIPWIVKPTTSGTGLPDWVCTTEELPAAGHEVALVLSAAHDALPDVRMYVQRALPKVRRLQVYTLPPYPSSTSIVDGAHALILTQSLCHQVNQNRTLEERAEMLHLFAAAPNSLLFLLGQQARSLGRCRVYEYAFGSNLPGGYQPALEFPPE
jgi:hypothetical protein